MQALAYARNQWPFSTAVRSKPEQSHGKAYIYVPKRLTSLYVKVTLLDCVGNRSNVSEKSNMSHEDDTEVSYSVRTHRRSLPETLTWESGPKCPATLRGRSVTKQI